MENGMDELVIMLGAPIDKVWTMVSQTKKLPKWMQMVERQP